MSSEEVLVFVHDEADYASPMLHEVDMHPLCEPHYPSLPLVVGGPIYICSTTRIVLHCALALKGPNSLPRGAHLAFALEVQYSS